MNLLLHLSNVRELPAQSEKSCKWSVFTQERWEGGETRCKLCDDRSSPRPAASLCPSFSLLWPTIDRSWVWSPVRQGDQTRLSPDGIRDVQLRHCDDQTFVRPRLISPCGTAPISPRHNRGIMTRLGIPKVLPIGLTGSGWNQGGEAAENNITQDAPADFQ